MSKTKWHTKAIYLLVALALVFSLVVVGATPSTVAADTRFVPGDYATIQLAVDASTPGDTIVVADGTYNEDVTIGKSLTLQGARAGECAVGRTGVESEIVGSIDVTAGDFTIDGFKVTGTGAGPLAGVCMRIRSTSATIVNNIIVAVEATGGYTVSGFVDLDVSDADIRCNDFSGAYEDDRRPNVIKVVISGGSSATVADNEMHDVGGGGGVGIMCDDASAVIEIRDNVIDNTGDGIWTYNSAFDTLLITGNDILNCRYNGAGDRNGSYIGVKIWTGVSGDVQIHCNNIEGNEEYGVYNHLDNPEADATSNWWGDPSGPSLSPGDGDKVSGNVLYEPWGEEPITTAEIVGEPILLPAIAKNVKTADETFTVIDTGTLKPVCGHLVTNWYVTKGEGTGEVSVVGGGEDGDNYITVRMVTMGDCVITCDVTVNDETVRLNAEKKWGDIARTELTAWDYPDTHCEQRPAFAGDTEISRAGIEIDEEVLVQEKVIANFLPGPVEAPAGGAKVTWWLLTNDDDDYCQGALEDLLERFDTYAYESGDLGWGEGCGQYAEWVGDPTFIPEVLIDGIFARCEADYTEIVAEECTTVAGTTKTVTYTDHALDPLGEGFTNVEVKFSQVPGTDIVEPVIVVLLADYPLDKNGENAVCVEYFKFSPKPPLPEECQVKTPQVRWAGEKIVLEKDWGCGNANMLVGYYLEEGAVGNMIPRIELGSWIDYMMGGFVYYVSEDARTVLTETDCYGVSRAVMESEQQGEADVKCVLYDMYVVDYAEGALEEMLQGKRWPPDDWIVIGNHGFLVYFLALEDVTVDSELSDLTGNEPGEDANVLVKVRGWFTSAALPGTSRPAVLGDDGITYVLPAGRYVLPDDWAALAGSYFATSNMASRPQYDLMNNPWWSGIGSPNPLGPYDTGVRTTDPPREAVNPVIGPFSTLQPWNCWDDEGNPTNMWMADAVVIADMTVASLTNVWEPWDLRNTVVPDYWIDEWDCPMPQALVTFDAWGDDLIQLDKGDVFYDSVLEYIAPFYEMEIPSHWFIPQAGYLWDSWGTTAINGPYGMWVDLGNTPNDDDILEVYSDNHGYAGVTLDALPEEGFVWLDVIADFPVMQCKYAAVDTYTEVVWGPPTPEYATWYLLFAGVSPKPIAGFDDPLWTAYDMEWSPAGELPDELIAVYWEDPASPGDWYMFVKAWKGEGLNDLWDLFPSEAAFYVQVSDAFVWDIPQV